ncbi:MFS transporter [Pengzhenrongella frigida]|uniref:MFS transporter n=1 Tax=Pengzhenrongella frigida TaxID=1259133 RepID=A0A4Q5N4Y3_9MICO|nr:MFS transporter [Cellulomonas sp. HLT2-17]RYV52473.1 MFS transporter [Cellulomonas sp. HLT2-17]
MPDPAVTAERVGPAPRSPATGRRAPWRAYLVWGTAVLAYMVAILDRSSLGVAGLEAGERFGASASVLSLFVVVQLVVYAGLQLPVGLMLDRVGPRRLIATGAVLMAIGQLTMALVTTIGPALGARALVGAGDALTFVSVLRLVPSWFPPRQVPLLTQLTGILGQFGQVAAAVPLVLLLHGPGWPSAFGSAAVLGLVMVIIVLVVVRDAPAAGRRRPAALPARASLAPRPSALRATLSEPGTWLGYWTHFVAQFSNIVIVLLWGFPFLVEGQGRTTAEASALFTINVVSAIVAGPLIGEFTARWPARRMHLVLGVAFAIAAAWLAVLVPSGPRPLWVLTVFMVVVAVGGPTSLVGFDFARSHNPPERLGTATGLINAGGFVAALGTMLGIGLVLDAVGADPGGAYSLDAYRLALSVVAIPWGIGVVGLSLGARSDRKHRAARAHAAQAAESMA